MGGPFLLPAKIGHFQHVKVIVNEGKFRLIHFPVLLKDVTHGYCTFSEALE
jgi:hypothetical protein